MAIQSVGRFPEVNSAIHPLPVGVESQPPAKMIISYGGGGEAEAVSQENRLREDLFLFLPRTNRAANPMRA